MMDVINYPCWDWNLLALDIEIFHPTHLKSCGLYRAPLLASLRWNNIDYLTIQQQSIVFPPDISKNKQKVHYVKHKQHNMDLSFHNVMLNVSVGPLD